MLQTEPDCLNKKRKFKSENMTGCCSWCQCASWRPLSSGDPEVVVPPLEDGRTEEAQTWSSESEIKNINKCFTSWSDEFSLRKVHRCFRGGHSSQERVKNVNYCVTCSFISTTKQPLICNRLKIKIITKHFVVKLNWEITTLCCKITYFTIL